MIGFKLNQWKGVVDSKGMKVQINMGNSRDGVAEVRTSQNMILGTFSVQRSTQMAQLPTRIDCISSEISSAQLT